MSTQRAGVGDGGYVEGERGREEHEPVEVRGVDHLPRRTCEHDIRAVCAGERCRQHMQTDAAKRKLAAKSHSHPHRPSTPSTQCSAVNR
eukprot:612806-Rhodomonas_salina.2